MLIVKIELHSAITGKVEEIGRMRIFNDGITTRENKNLGSYNIHLMRKGSINKVQKTGRVENYPRKSYSVWKLVKKALNNIL